MCEFQEAGEGKLIFLIKKKKKKNEEEMLHE